MASQHLHQPTRICLGATRQQHHTAQMFRLSQFSRTRAAPVTNASQAGHPTAVITGSSTGIGRETALLLAQKGWHVYAGARKNEDLQQLEALHDNIKPIHLDVTLQDSIAAAAEQVGIAVADSGLQLLVNNAGIGVVAPVEYFPLQDFRQVMEVNLFGAVATSQAFIPLLRQGPQKGRIINISSVAGHLSLPLWSAYCTSKHALEGFSDCLRYELAPLGVPVVLIKPGPVKTPIWEKSTGRSQEIRSELPKEAVKLYGKALEVMAQEAEKSSQSAIPVEEVAQLIYTAASVDTPASRYHIGANAYLYHWLKRLLPDRVWETLITSSLAGNRMNGKPQVVAE